MLRVELEGRGYGFLPPEGGTRSYYEEVFKEGYNLLDPPKKISVILAHLLPDGLREFDLNQDVRKGYLNGLGQRFTTHLKENKDMISRGQKQTIEWVMQIIGWKAALSDEFMEGVLQGIQSKGVERKQLERELLSSSEKQTIVELNRADGFRLGRIVQNLRERNIILTSTMAKLPKKVFEGKRLQ